MSRQARTFAKPWAWQRREGLARRADTARQLGIPRVLEDTINEAVKESARPSCDMHGGCFSDAPGKNLTNFFELTSWLLRVCEGEH